MLPPNFFLPWRPALAILAIATFARISQAQELSPSEATLQAGATTPAGQPPTVESPPATPPKKTPKRKTNALPPLQIYSGAARLGLRGGPSALAPDAAPPPALAALPGPPPRRRPPADENPFAPIGIDVGDLKLLPYLEEDVGFASNPSRTAAPAKGSGFETTEAGLSFTSDWSRDELHGNLRGGYTYYFTQSQANAPFGSGTLGGRLDVSHEASLDGEVRFNVTTQLPGAVTLPSGAVLGQNSHPLITSLGATFGGSQNFGDLAFSLHGSLDHTAYQDATLAGGFIDKLSSDSYADWGLRARVAWRASPVAAPFVELDGDLRRYDSSVDFNGYARNSKGGAALAGLELSLSQKLTGEVDAGYGARQYQDARLANLRGPMIDAALIWSATPLTTIRLRTQTILADTTTPGISGALQRSYTIDVSHALLRNLTLGAAVGFATNEYSGQGSHDQTLSYGLNAEYDLNRNVVLKASATRSQLTSSLPGSNYTDNVFMLGLRFQQ